MAVADVVTVVVTAMIATMVAVVTTVTDGGANVAMYTRATLAVCGSFLGLGSMVVVVMSLLLPAFPFPPPCVRDIAMRLHQR